MLVVLTDQRTIFSIGSVSQSSLPSYFNKHYNSPMVDPPSKLDILACPIIPLVTAIPSE